MAELADFKDTVVALVNEQIEAGRSGKPKLEDFRFLIFSGDANASEFNKIRDAVVEILPHFADKVLDKIDPVWAGAAGAATRARDFFVNPPVWPVSQFQTEAFDFVFNQTGPPWH